MKITTVTMLVSFPALAFSALPPGYQDKLLCPCNFCRVRKQTAFGWVGYVCGHDKSLDIVEKCACYSVHNNKMRICRPQSSFVQCQNSCGDVQPVTTWGSMINTANELTDLQNRGYHEHECSESSVEMKYACTNGASHIEHHNSHWNNQACCSASPSPPAPFDVVICIITEAVSCKPEGCTMWNDGKC